MKKLLQFFSLKSKNKVPKFYPWYLFKELEDSLNLIADLDQIAIHFLGKIKEIIPARKLILAIYDQDIGRFRINCKFGLDKSELKNVVLNHSSSLVKWLKVNQTYFSVRDNPGVFNYLTEKEKHIIKSLELELCFPLISKNRLIGIIFIGPKENKEKFSRQELNLISMITPQASIALENAVLYKEQKERFRRMSRADKLATIGELAAGAAHEIRNPLTAIKSTLQYLKKKKLDKTSDRLLNTALRETERIDEILLALLSFSRPYDIKKEKCNLLEIIEESLELVSFQARKQKIEIFHDFPSSLVYLHGDKAQLKQLFLNLFLNSLQAMNTGDELRIEVKTSDNQGILVAITDTGKGIPDENLDKIFDPFFTTKKGGTGLGLSICYGIVKSHHGEIEIKSSPNKGTTALVRFPLNRE